MEDLRTRSSHTVRRSPAARVLRSSSRLPESVPPSSSTCSPSVAGARSSPSCSPRPAHAGLRRRCPRTQTLRRDRASALAVTSRCPATTARRPRRPAPPIATSTCYLPVGAHRRSPPPTLDLAVPSAATGCLSSRSAVGRSELIGQVAEPYEHLQLRVPDPGTAGGATTTAQPVPALPIVLADYTIRRSTAHPATYREAQPADGRAEDHGPTRLFEHSRRCRTRSGHLALSTMARTTRRRRSSCTTCSSRLEPFTTLRDPAAGRLLRPRRPPLPLARLHVPQRHHQLGRRQGAHPRPLLQRGALPQRQRPRPRHAAGRRLRTTSSMPPWASAAV